MKTLINLIGEQPIPNIIPILYLNPDRTIILYTNKTEKIASRINRIKQVEKLKIEAYNFNSTHEALKGYLNFNDELIFNITGGTKLMSISLFQYAMQTDSKSIYIQSEGNSNKLYTLELNDDEVLGTSSQIIPEVIDLDIYLKAHLDGYKIATHDNPNLPGIKFENKIVELLEQNDFEVLQGVKPINEGEQLEIDLIFRKKGTNIVSIAEVKLTDGKTNEKPKRGIDQLSTVGSREYLGIYKNKFLITSRKIPNELQKMAINHNVIVIDNIYYNSKRDIITYEGKNKLIQKINEQLN